MEQLYDWSEGKGKDMYIIWECGKVTIKVNQLNGRREGRVGLKRGMGNEEMGNGNEEMEMWKYRSSIIQLSRNAPPSL